MGPWPDHITAADAEALDELAAAGIGEGDLDDDHGVPADLVELYEVLEWENAVADAAGDALPHPDTDIPPPIDPGTVHSTPLVSRAGWGARAPLSVTRRDLTENTAHYGGPSPWGAGVDRSSAARFAATADHTRCPAIVRAYQAFHMDTRGWQDIAYSSLTCPHGVRYEGRGPNVRTAANGTTAGNNASHATCYLAGDADPLTDGAKRAFGDEHVRLEGLHKGHRDWKSTACPGDALYAWVHAGRPQPSSPGGFLDMLTDAQQQQLYDRVMDIPLSAANHLTVQGALQEALGHTGGTYPTAGTDGHAAAQLRARAREGAVEAIVAALDNPVVQAKVRALVTGT